MGMFDEIRCEYPLPNPELQDELFQTKDFYRLLENYTITKDGKLVHHSVYWGEVQVPYTGDFRFYTSRGSHADTLEWFEYRAEFKGGQLQSINRVNTADRLNGSRS